MIPVCWGGPLYLINRQLVCRLAGAVGLDRLCEQMVAGLASAAGMTAPAAGGSPAEAKQVAALEALVQVGFVDKLQLSACQSLVTRCISLLLKHRGSNNMLRLGVVEMHLDACCASLQASVMLSASP